MLACALVDVNSKMLTSETQEMDVARLHGLSFAGQRITQPEE